MRSVKVWRTTQHNTYNKHLECGVRYVAISYNDIITFFPLYGRKNIVDMIQLARHHYDSCVKECRKLNAHEILEKIREDERLNPDKILERINKNASTNIGL
jgi:hypothetical protein